MKAPMAHAESKREKGRASVLLPSLLEYVHEWEDAYKNSISHIPLFNTTPDLGWTFEQKQYFCKVFYHARGHFTDFLWHMGNVAPDIKAKNLVLYNYAEEFGGHAPSHEQLYFYFSQELGLVNSEEVTDEQYYLPFLKDFNKAHLRWLGSHGWDGCLAAYSAYERLDNLDYANLLILTKNMGVGKKGMIFFKVHSQVEHFESTMELLNESWKRNEAEVRESFDFIASHQKNMWKTLSDVVFSFG